MSFLTKHNEVKNPREHRFFRDDNYNSFKNQN